MRRPPIEEVGAELRDMMPGSNSAGGRTAAPIFVTTFATTAARWRRATASGGLWRCAGVGPPALARDLRENGRVTTFVDSRNDLGVAGVARVAGRV